MTLASVMARLLRHPREVSPTVPYSPRSQVVVLADDRELRDAIERAMAFERGAALRAAEHLSRYERMARNGGSPEEPAREDLARHEPQRIL